MSNSLGPHGLYSSWNSPGQNSGVGSLSLLQGIFPTHGSNPGLPNWRQILYQVSHKGNPTTLKGVANPFSSESSWPRNQTAVSCIAGGFFTNWASGKSALFYEVWEVYASSFLFWSSRWLWQFWAFRSRSNSSESRSVVSDSLWLHGWL